MANPTHEVRIHIDEESYHSATPTTGAALYALASIPPGRELFREVEGDRGDEPVPRNDAPVQLTEDEHFHSVREFHIVVNTRRKEVTTPKLSFNDLLRLAFDPIPTGPNIHFTITYRHGPRQNPVGEMEQGQRVRIKNGMVFVVEYTDRS